jgi:MFS family permease
VQPAYRDAALALRSLAGFGAGAAAPLVFGALLDLHGGVQAERIGWAWAFASLGLAGAVTAVMVLHRLLGARALTVGHRRTPRGEPRESVLRER